MARPNMESHHRDRTMNWSEYDLAKSSPVEVEEPALPSSFIMDDGTDWNSHIGSFFDSQLPRKTSSIDFGMTGCYTSDTQLPQSSDNTMDFNDFDHQACPPQDHITLQDVMDVGEHGLLLQTHDDPWSSIRRPIGEVIVNTEPQYTSDVEHVGHYSNAVSHRDVSEGVEVSESTDPCYARLLWRCLHEAPQHTLSLKDIYSWIKQHTQKARDPKNKGWQNSVRHNLSMNAAFERVAISNSSGGESKKGSLWRLTEHAVATGVISTTRYRRDPKRKPERRGQPALKRQLSGAKGGAATRAASHYKRLREARDGRARSQHTSSHLQRHYTSTPESSSATPVAIHMHQGYPHQAHPPSPYYFSATTMSPAIMHHSALSSPYASPMMQLASEQGEKECFRDFQLSHLEYNTGLFNNVDTNRPYTPSLLTESSFYTDDSRYGQFSDPMMSAS